MRVQNPEYDFLRDTRLPEHLYYRWRLWSLCNGDSLDRWRTQPFVMVQHGCRIVPPLQTAAQKPVALTAAQLGACPHHSATLQP